MLLMNVNCVIVLNINSVIGMVWILSNALGWG